MFAAPSGLLDVFGLGQCVVDQLGLVERYPAPDEKAEMNGMVVSGGGPVATALFALARWERRVALCGVVGDDFEGLLIRTELEQAGVDTSRLLVRPDQRSQRAFVAIERGSGRRMIFWQRPTGAPPGAHEVAWPEARIFLTDGLFAEASLAVARRARRVVVDAGTLREGTRALLDCAQVFVASESFALEFAGDDDPKGACRKMREHGIEVAGVTLGARGYVASFGDTFLERPAHPVRAVDTTGCGDLFHAGIVEGMLSGWSMERSFDFAAWAAACCATAIGGRGSVCRRAEFPG